MTSDPARGTKTSPSGPVRSLARRLFWPALATAVAFAVLLTLGSWQVARLNWKLALIERVETRVDAAPVPAPGPAAWPDLETDDWDYRPVEVRGRYLDGEVYYYISLADARGETGGPGYFVYAPFRADRGFVVMVNRGFVPDGRRRPGTRPGSAAPGGEVTLSGLWRRDERGNMFTLEADKGIWFVREARKMAAALGVSDPDTRIAPYSIDAGAEQTPASGLPQAGETIVSFTNNHLQYAVTWYGLALVLLAVFFAYARGEARRGDDARGEARRGDDARGEARRDQD
ncbi:SURF1 family protein [Stappia sp. ES.058]|uniref:SURF1 family protein n=1 Tax=Stappia sp. ES.058 TaxID=1881061 RepID=UPI00087DC2DA|nr:SURF1 family protein [Stappia sp. ES.058]SDT91965.1 surfeit locus 1 family protein [Stappia sp. ES.058]